MKRDIQRFKEFEKFFKKFLIKNYGRKCPDYCFDCAACRAWRIYEDFDSWVCNVESLEKWEFGDKRREKRKSGNNKKKSEIRSPITLENKK